MSTIRLCTALLFELHPIKSPTALKCLEVLISGLPFATKSNYFQHQVTMAATLAQKQLDQRKSNVFF